MNKPEEKNQRNSGLLQFNRCLWIFADSNENNENQRFSGRVLPVTSCVSSLLLLLTILTDTFLDDCRNSGRPCGEIDQVTHLKQGATVIKLLMLI